MPPAAHFQNPTKHTTMSESTKTRSHPGSRGRGSSAGHAVVANRGGTADALRTGERAGFYGAAAMNRACDEFLRSLGLATGSWREGRA